MAISYDPFGPGVLINPYPWYRWLRSEAPCHHVEAHDFWVISRYDDVDAALRNHAVFSSSEGVGFERRSFHDMISADPPEHTRLRRLVDRQFLPRAVAQLETRVGGIIDALLDPIIERGRVDLVEDLAAPLPLVVIAELLGIEPERRSDFKRWSDDLLLAVGGGLDEATRTRTEASRHAMAEYIRAAAAERRTRPESSATDIIGTLVTASDHDALTTREVIAFCMLLLIAGNETTTNTVANGALAIMEHPDQWRFIMRDAGLIPSFVEESLRFDSPIQGFFRTTRADVEVAGATIPAGARVLLLFGSANRDDHHYPDADTFLTTRNPLDHLAFGKGIHFCLGAHLARLELTLLLRAILARVRRLLPDGEVVRVRNPIARGVHRLPVVVEPR